MFPGQPFQFQPGGGQQPYGQSGHQPQSFGQQIICPRCHGLMTEVREPESGINIDVCTNPGCGGYYFDFCEFQMTANAVLRGINLGHRQIPVPNGFGHGYSILSGLLGGGSFGFGCATIQCPKCHGQMFETREYNINVDTCHGCGGMFFDGGEFQAAVTTIANGLGHSGFSLHRPNMSQYGSHGGHGHGHGHGQRSFLQMLLG